MGVAQQRAAVIIWQPPTERQHAPSSGVAGIPLIVKAGLYKYWKSCGFGPQAGTVGDWTVLSTANEFS